MDDLPEEGANEQVEETNTLLNEIDVTADREQAIVQQPLGDTDGVSTGVDSDNANKDDDVGASEIDGGTGGNAAPDITTEHGEETSSVPVDATNNVNGTSEEASSDSSSESTEQSQSSGSEEETESESEEDTQEKMLSELAETVKICTDEVDPDTLTEKLKNLKMRGILFKSSPEFVEAEALVPVLKQRKLQKLRQTLLEVPVLDLQRAAYEDDAAQVNVLINKHKWFVDRRDQQTNTTPLQWSAINGQSSAAEELLRRGAAINNRDEFGRTALHHAALYGSANTAASLLKMSKCEVDCKDQHGYTALILAAEGGHVSTISALLGAGANINAVNKAGASALHEASFHGKPGAIELLVNSGSNLVCRDADGNTAMHYAAEQGHGDCVKALLIGKADIRMCNNFQENILHVAAESGQVDFIREFGVCTVSTTTNGQIESDTTGSDAKTTGTETGTGTAIEEKADGDEHVDAPIDGVPDGETNTSTSPNLAEIVTPDPEHIDVNECDSNGETPLFKAIDANACKAGKLLLEMKANVNASDFYGRTAMHRAMANNFFEAAKLLVRADADLTLMTYGKETPIDVAENPQLGIKIREIQRKHNRDKKRRKQKLDLLKKREAIEAKDKEAEKAKMTILDEAKHVAKVEAANIQAEQSRDTEEENSASDNLEKKAGDQIEGDASPLNKQDSHASMTDDVPNKNITPGAN